MAQTWTDDSFAAGHVAQTDLQNMENNFACLKSSFSGAVQSAGVVEGTLWRDTAKKVLKQYNGASWFGMFHGDATQKILVYDDTVLEGYLRDAGVTDKVIALKGGATYVTAGVTAGTWTIGSIAAANESTHVHAQAIHSHPLKNVSFSIASAASWTPVASYPVIVGGTHAQNYEAGGGALNDRNILDNDTNNSGAVNVGAGAAHTHVMTQGSYGAAARIMAAVVILVYLDL